MTDEKILVAMKATFTTDGNPEDKRRRTVRALMDSDRIINAPTLQDAIEYFKSQVPYVDTIESFEFFKIGNKEYETDCWNQ